MFDDFVRVYFSGRPAPDANGQYASRSGFVDLERGNLMNVLRVSEQPILPLGDTGAHGASLMFNWIGELPDPAPVLRTVDGHWHDYGKQARPGRKVGHATVCAPDASTLVERAEALAQLIGWEQPVAAVRGAFGD